MAEHGGSAGGGGGGVLRELIAIFGFGVDTEELKEGENALDGFVKKIEDVATGLAGVFLLKEINEFAEGGVKAMVEVEHAAVRLGISAEQVQEFGYAANMANISSETLYNSMGRLQVVQNAAATGNAQAAKSFSDLGVKVRNEDGTMKDAGQLFSDVADKISDIEDPSKQAGAAVKLFGRGGRELLPILKEGADGLAEMAEEFQQLGGGYSEKAREASEHYEKASKRLGATLTSLKSHALEGLLPVLEEIAKWTQVIVVKFLDLVKNSNFVKSTLIALGIAGAVMAAQLVVAFAPFIALTAGLVLVIAVIDELITLFEGGDTLIGRTIDDIFGEGKSAEVVENIKDTWKELVTEIKDAYKWITDFWKTLTDVGDYLGKSAVNAGEDLVNAQAPAQKVANVKAQRVNAMKNGQVYIAPGESFGEAKQRGLDALRESVGTGPNADIAGVARSITGLGSAPLTPTTPAPAASGGEVTITIGDVISNASDPKVVADEVGKVFDEKMKHRNRGTASTYQRSNPNK